MPKLQWCGGQKEHRIELAAERSSRLEKLGVFDRIVSCKQRREPSCGILDVMSLVEDQKGRSKIGSSQRNLPPLLHCACDPLTCSLQPIFEIGRVTERKLAK